MGFSAGLSLLRAGAASFLTLCGCFGCGAGRSAGLSLLGLDWGACDCCSSACSPHTSVTVCSPRTKREREKANSLGENLERGRRRAKAVGECERTTAGSTPLAQQLLDVASEHLARVFAQQQKPCRRRHAAVQPHLHPGNQLPTCGRVCEDVENQETERDTNERAGRGLSSMPRHVVLPSCGAHGGERSKRRAVSCDKQ